jgi:predicted alpha/beta-hydrolase family hydrolase
MSVRRLHIAWLSLIFAALLPFSVIAANEEDSASSETETSQTKSDAGSPEESMLRQISPIYGFQALTVAGQEIDATYIEETFGDRHGAIVLLHEQGEQIDSSGVVTTLRHHLPDYGWSTLTVSLNFPFEPDILLSTSLETTQNETSEGLSEQKNQIEDKSANLEQAVPKSLPPISNQQRIEAAVAFLQAKDIKQIVFIGHGKGGEIAVEIMNTIATPIFGLIMVGTPALPTNEQFLSMGQPILDIYGGQDLNSVSKAVKDRRIAMKREANTNYSERKIDGANHDFDGLQLMLTSTIRGWLKSSFLEQE